MKTDTLSLTNPKFVAVQKDQFFYGRYEYCFGFTLAEANILRNLNHESIDSRLDQRIEWRETARKRFQSDGGWNKITPQIREDLHNVCDAILQSGVDYKLVVTTHFGWLYTNSITLIKQLMKFRCLSGMTYTQAVINRPKNTILLKNSPHQSRSYFYNLKLTEQEKHNLKNFFSNQKEHVRISPSLANFLYEKPYQRIQEYFFIDYVGDQWLTMLSLIRPGLFRKTLAIINK
jgi:hypothetical protein